MDMARVERPVIWDGMFNLWIGEVIVFTHSDKQFLDGMAGRINSALSGMVERSVVDGLVEGLKSIKDSREFFKVTADKNLEPNLYKVQCGARDAVSVLSEKAERILAAYESKTGRGVG